MWELKIKLFNTGYIYFIWIKANLSPPECWHKNVHVPWCLIPNRDKGLREAIWLCTLVRRLTGWGCKRAKIMYYWRVQKHCRIFSGFHLKPKKTHGRLCTAGWRDKYYFLMKALICSFTEGWDYEVERNSLHCSLALPDIHNSTAFHILKSIWRPHRSILQKHELKYLCGFSLCERQNVFLLWA